MRKFLNFNRVLCLSPHPDDIEYSMSGVIMKYKDTHFDVVCLTQGGDCDNTTGIDRLSEVKNAWLKSGVNNYTLHFSENKFLKEKGIDEWVNWLEKKFILEYKYDCVITPSNEDSHFEHKIVCELGYPLTRVSNMCLMEYYSPSTLETWIPNLFVDISQVYDTKLNMLKEFVSQKNKTYFQNDTILGFHTNFRCSKRGIGITEQFKIKQIFL